MIPLDKVIDRCYAALERFSLRQKGDSMTGVVLVTEVATINGCDVPIEALIFPPDRTMVIYSRLLADPRMLVGLPADVPVGDLFYDAVLN